MATHSSILAWEIPWTEMSGQATVHEVTKKLGTTQRLAQTQYLLQKRSPDVQR